MNGLCFMQFIQKKRLLPHIVQTEKEIILSLVQSIDVPMSIGVMTKVISIRYVKEIS